MFSLSIVFFHSFIASFLRLLVLLYHHHDQPRITTAWHGISTQSLESVLESDPLQFPYGVHPDAPRIAETLRNRPAYEHWFMAGYCIQLRLSPNNTQTQIAWTPPQDNPRFNIFILLRRIVQPKICLHSPPFPSHISGLAANIIL